MCDAPSGGEAIESFNMWHQTKSEEKAEREQRPPSQSDATCSIYVERHVAIGLPLGGKFSHAFKYLIKVTLEN